MLQYGSFESSFQDLRTVSRPVLSSIKTARPVLLKSRDLAQANVDELSFILHFILDDLACFTGRDRPKEKLICLGCSQKRQKILAKRAQLTGQQPFRSISIDWVTKIACCEAIVSWRGDGAQRCAGGKDRGQGLMGDPSTHSRVY